MTTQLELGDIQGLVLSGYGDKPAARYAIFQIVDGEAARRWLGRLINALQFGSFRGSRRRDPPYLGDLCCNVAFTHAGFRALGLAEIALAGFAQPFQEGMSEASRARRLGDEGESAPENWQWGRPGEPVHGLLAVFGGLGDAVAEDWVRIEEFISAQLCPDHGVKLFKLLDTVASNRTRRKEPFGFRDGIANPRIGSLPRDRSDDIVQAGEILLGHENTYDKLPMSPELPKSLDSRGILPQVAARPDRHDFGKNGSYLVFRQLKQDVQGFWNYVERARQSLPDAPPDRAGREWLAAKLVGRWPNGTPVALFPDAPGPAVDQDAEAFTYGANDDSFGERCPIGAHIRRTNPRDTALPVPHDPELSGDPAQDIVVRKERLELTNRHRILRRGRAYGPPVDDEYDIDALRSQGCPEERGLHFLCFNANLSRQFEFVQSNWVQNPSFAGLSSDPDPLLGADRKLPFRARDFTIQGCPVRRVHELPRVVETRGGAYFFMPSRRALEYLASDNSSRASRR
jgi:Dyp-type peroxidase family